MQPRMTVSWFHPLVFHTFSRTHPPTHQTGTDRLIRLMTDLSLARIQFDANCSVQQDTDLITPVGLRVVCKHFDTFHRIPAHANTDKWSLHLCLLRYNLCWGHWFFPLPTPHPHQAPLPQHEKCRLYIHPNPSITYTHTYTHTLKRLQQLKVYYLPQSAPR